MEKNANDNLTDSRIKNKSFDTNDFIGNNNTNSTVGSNNTNSIIRNNNTNSIIRNNNTNSIIRNNNTSSTVGSNNADSFIVNHNTNNVNNFDMNNNANLFNINNNTLIDRYIEGKDNIIYTTNTMIDSMINKRVNKISDYQYSLLFNPEDKRKDLEKNIHDDIRLIIDKKYKDFFSIITDFNKELQYIKSGSTGHTFKGTRENNSYAIKVVAYPRHNNYGNVYDIKRPENAEILMIYILSYFVINKLTPHITLPIISYNTNFKPFEILYKKKILQGKKMKSFINNYRNNEYYNTISVLISEWAEKGDLLDYFRNNFSNMKEIDFKVIFFQIVSVLAVIHQRYPDFRHNDLKANNLLVTKTDIQDKYIGYNINGVRYKVPNIDIQILLWDFDFACIPNIIDNSKVNSNWTDKINVNPKKNQYYDIHYFFSTLSKKGFIPDILDNNKTPNNVVEFIKRVIPYKNRCTDMVTDRGRFIGDHEFITPTELLDDIFFDEFKVKKIK